jgi:hypothetical protein
MRHGNFPSAYFGSRLPQPRQAANLLFALVTRRYERRSISTVAQAPWLRNSA